VNLAAPTCEGHRKFPGSEGVAKRKKRDRKGPVARGAAMSTGRPAPGGRRKESDRGTNTRGTQTGNRGSRKRFHSSQGRRRRKGTCTAEINKKSSRPKNDYHPCYSPQKEPTSTTGPKGDGAKTTCVRPQNENQSKGRKGKGKPMIRKEKRQAPEAILKRDAGNSTKKGTRTGGRLPKEIRLNRLRGTRENSHAATTGCRSRTVS